MMRIGVKIEDWLWYRECGWYVRSIDEGRSCTVAVQIMQAKLKRMEAVEKKREKRPESESLTLADAGSKGEHATHEETEMGRSTINRNYTHVTREHQFLAKVRGEERMEDEMPRANPC
jgi:hypothetical protein